MFDIDLAEHPRKHEDTRGRREGVRTQVVRADSPPDQVSRSVPRASEGSTTPRLWSYGRVIWCWSGSRPGPPTHRLLTTMIRGLLTACMVAHTTAVLTTWMGALPSSPNSPFLQRIEALTNRASPRTGFGQRHEQVQSRHATRDAEDLQRPQLEANDQLSRLDNLLMGMKKLARQQARETTPGGVDFSQATRQPDGRLCVIKEETVKTLLKNPILECNHKEVEKCHLTYVTQFNPVQEEQCEEIFEKSCQITFRAEAATETVRKCYRPQRKVCNGQGPEQCRTEYESSCTTR